MYQSATRRHSERDHGSYRVAPSTLDNRSLANVLTFIRPPRLDTCPRPLLTLGRAYSSGRRLCHQFLRMWSCLATARGTIPRSPAPPMRCATRKVTRKATRKATSWERPVRLSFRCFSSSAPPRPASLDAQLGPLTAGMRWAGHVNCAGIRVSGQSILHTVCTRAHGTHALLLSVHLLVSGQL